MKTALCLALGFVSTLAFAEHYGAPIVEKNPVPLAVAIKKLDSSRVADVVVESRVDKVCVVKGCWLGLTDASGEIRVTFKDYAFFVPPSLIGKNVVVAGKLEKVTMSLEDTKHYVKDAGGDPATVTQPRVEYRIVASGVEVRT